MYAVLILTKDEEVNIADCLRSIPPGVEVVVLDSLSQDRTAEIAQGLGARVEYRAFDNYAAQRNFGLRSIEYATPWILMLDADERLSDALHQEILRALADPSPAVTLYRMRRKDMFMRRWLRRSSGYPTWFGRLALRERVCVEREINEEFITDGEVGYFDEHLIHYPFNKGIAYWIERHNRYSSMEATALFHEVSTPIEWTKLLDGDPAIRRKWLKQIAYRLPGRPALIFLYLWIFRGGLFDGRAGFAYCTLRFIYECMINAKLEEMRGR